MLYHIYNSNIPLKKSEKKQELTERNIKILKIYPTFMICYLNGFDDAKERLIEAKPL
jgi:hypothetical protein